MEEILLYYQRFTNEYYLFYFFWCALIIVFFAYPKLRSILIYPNLIVIIVFFSPFLKQIIEKYFLGEGVYWRIWWLIPINLIMTLGFTAIIFKINKKNLRIIVSVICIILVMLTGKCYFVGEHISHTENLYKMPNEIIQVADVIEDDIKANEIKEGKIVAVYDVAWQMRLYKPELEMLYGRNPYSSDGWYTSDIYIDINASDEVNFSQLDLYLRLNGVSHLVLKKSQIENFETTIIIEEKGYRILLSTENYVVLRTNIPNVEGEYRIIQCPTEVCGSNFYIIVNKNQQLILINGGEVEETEYVKSMVNLLGGKVYAWIITDLKARSIGAFTQALEESSIEVNCVYTMEMSDREYYEIYEDDNVELYERFKKTLDNQKRVYCVKQGNRYTVLDFELDILSVYDDTLLPYSSNLINDTTMIFKLSIQDQSILFLQNTSETMINWLMVHRESMLDTTHLQVGEYVELNNDALNMITPEVIIFDSNKHNDRYLFENKGDYEMYYLDEKVNVIGIH